MSTFVNAFGMNAMLLEAIAELVGRGIEPSNSRSSNGPGGDEANVAVMGRDKPRVKDL